MRKLKDKPCYYCRGPINEIQTVSVETYESFITNENLPDVHPFEVLFGSKYRRLYELFRYFLNAKWTKVADNSFSKVCQVCTLLHKHQGVDTTLLSLFYACSTITRTSVLDAMTCLGVLFGLRSVAKISPKDVYFHFFLNHCSTGRAVGEKDHSGVSDFVTSIMHALTYDIPEIDAIASFINTMAADGSDKCGCNEAQAALLIVNRKVERADTNEEEDADGMSPFVPEERAFVSKKIGWDNSYKWVAKKDASQEGEEEEKGEKREALVDCLSVFSDCRVCDSMMDYSAYTDLKEMDDLIQLHRKYMNVETAVSVVCTEKNKTDQTFVAHMTKHYTSHQCELNRLKFIHFYSLVKQPSSLKSSPAALHLFNELFRSKRSYLCPTYHLACLSDCIVKADSSQMKKTKRESIQRWANKVFQQHPLQVTK